jgi:hypothetical protein
MSDDSLSQFDLRFQDLLRHADWEVITCDVIGTQIYTGQSHNEHLGVRHKRGGFRIVIKRVLPDIFDTCIIVTTTRAERKQLSKFAREVVRLEILKMAGHP